MPSAIHTLPPELIETILVLLDPTEVASFSQTCREFNLLIYNSPDQSLWRALYLAQPLDDPRQCVTHLGDPLPTEFDWRYELQRIIRARTIVEEPSKCKPSEREEVLGTLVRLATHVPPTHPVLREPISENLLWIAAMLRRGTLLDNHGWSDVTPNESQLIARLHTYHGLTPADFLLENRIKSLAYVYNLSKYRYGNDFGPWMADGSGRVNWEHVRALHHTVSLHMVPMNEGDGFEYAIYPLSSTFCQPLLESGSTLGKGRDWAGVEGVWKCGFSFIDHRELLMFNNFNRGSTQPLDSSLFSDDDFHEIFREVSVQFHILSTDEDLEHPARPKIHFAGKLSDEHVMVGTVSLTDDDQIRWHFVSDEDGQATWSGEGVQVGSVCSPFGVLGAWTTANHDPYDPVGPLWLHKISSQESVPADEV